MATLTARDWIMAAVTRLGTHGIDAVKVEPLAADLGVSKGSFYWHFDNRDGLLASLLSMWEALGTEAIISDLDSSAATPEDRIHRLIERTFGDPDYDSLELGFRTWAHRDPAARVVVERVDARRMAYVASLIEACGVPARDAQARSEFMYRTLIGEFVMRSHGAAPLPHDTLSALGESLVRP